MLHTSLKDLELAENVIDKMVKAKKFPEFYETWQYYLYRCERALKQAGYTALSLGRLKINEEKVE